MSSTARLTVLLSVMNEDMHIIDRVGIRSPGIVINQTDTNKYVNIPRKTGNIDFYSFAEKGVGLSRNNALMRCSSEFGLFVDDDEILSHDYVERVVSAFDSLPEADVIVFNIGSDSEDRKPYQNTKIKRVRLYNCLRYGGCRIAVKTDSIHRKNIYFSLLFGGGAKYSNGEDTIFLTDCLKQGLKIYAHPYFVGSVNFDSSTWFKGHNVKFFNDRGVLIKTIFGRLSWIVCIYIAARLHKRYKKEVSFIRALSLMLRSKP